jgi:hypothetical protein
MDAEKLHGRPDPPPSSKYTHTAPMIENLSPDFACQSLMLVEVMPLWAMLLYE